MQCTQAEAAAFFGVSQVKFKRLLDNDKRVRKAWEEGFEKGKLSLRRKQMRLAGTNAQMSIHLGKQYLGQTDSKSLELTGVGGGPLETLDVTKLDASERKQLRAILTTANADPTPAG